MPQLLRALHKRLPRDLALQPWKEQRVAVDLEPVNSLPDELA
jgi:hypothetical protein